MAGNYSVDDILKELREKRQAQASASVVRKPETAKPPVEPESESKEKSSEPVEQEEPYIVKEHVAEAEIKEEAEEPEEKESEVSEKDSFGKEPKLEEYAEISEYKPAEEAPKKMKADHSSPEERTQVVSSFAPSEKKEEFRVNIVFEEEENTAEKISEIAGIKNLDVDEKKEEGGISKDELINLKTEEFSVLSENLDKAKAWETFVKLTEIDDGSSKKKPVSQENEENSSGLTEEIDDYNDKDDERSISFDLKSLRAKLRLRTGICMVFALALFLLSLLANPIFDVIPILSPQLNPIIYLSANLALTVVPILFCLPTVLGGIGSFFTMKADNDSAVALAVFGTLLFNIYLIAFPENYDSGAVYLYSFVAILSLGFNALGKGAVVKRVRNNFKFICDDSDKYALNPVSDSVFTSRVIKNGFMDEPMLVSSNKVKFLKNFLNNSYSEDASDKLSKYIVPISFVAAIVAAGLSYYANPNITVALGVFVLMLVACSPFAAFLCANMPLLKAAKKCLKHGGMLSGYSAVDTFCMTDGILVESNELFPDESIVLHGIKTFDGQRIDEAILDAASVVCIAGTTLSQVFSQVIEGKREMLKPVDTLVYEDSMGVSAWVDSKRVLIGTKELMNNHNIDVPSDDYESKYVGEGKKAIYLANSGTLTAMFVVSYRADKAVKKAVWSLERNGVKIAVRTTDPNITEKMLSDIFDVDESVFAIVPSSVHIDYKEQTVPKEHCEALAAHTGRFPAYAAAISASHGAKRAVSSAVFLELCSIMLTFLVVAILAIIGAIVPSASPFNLFVYQIAWLIVIVGLPSLRRYE